MKAAFNVFKEAIYSIYLSKSSTLHTSEGASPLKCPAGLNERKNPFSGRGERYVWHVPMAVRVYLPSQSTDMARPDMCLQGNQGKNSIPETKLSIKDKSFLTSVDY